MTNKILEFIAGKALGQSVKGNKLKEEYCSSCNGTGKLNRKTCPSCNGLGKIFK